RLRIGSGFEQQHFTVRIFAEPRRRHAARRAAAYDNYVILFIRHFVSLSSLCPGEGKLRALCVFAVSWFYSDLLNSGHLAKSLVQPPGKLLENQRRRCAAP